MKHLKKIIGIFIMTGLLGSLSAGAIAATADDLNIEATQGLEKLVKTNDVAKFLNKKAKAVIIFPSVVKAGLIFGGAYGEGVMKKDDKVVGYYNSVTASWGFQAGAQSYGYVLFLMSDEAVDYVKDTKGWEIGVGPTVVALDEGLAKNLSTSSMQDDAYAYIFDQKGLMASMSLEGTKISRIDRK